LPEKVLPELSRTPEGQQNLKTGALENLTHDTFKKEGTSDSRSKEPIVAEKPESVMTFKKSTP
jgi:hypothetical protein